MTPTRVVFDGQKRFEVLTLTNRGMDTATFQITVIQYRMNRAGRLESIQTPDSGQHFATDLVRFYPRSVTIAPGETQNVRVQVRLPSGLPEGEYRSHFAFNRVSGAEQPEPDSTTPGGSGEFAVHLSALYGVSIPVIVRHGDLEANVALRNLAIEARSDTAQDALVLHMTVDRTGPRSVFGNMNISLRRADGSHVRIGGANGVAVYTPITERDVRVPIQLPDNVRLAGGTVEVEYRRRTDEGDGTIARAEVAIP